MWLQCGSPILSLSLCWRRKIPRVLYGIARDSNRKYSKIYNGIILAPFMFQSCVMPCRVFWPYSESPHPTNGNHSKHHTYRKALSGVFRFRRNFTPNPKYNIARESTSEMENQKQLYIYIEMRAHSNKILFILHIYSH